MRNLYAVPDLPKEPTVRVKLDARTPDGRKALRLIDVPTSVLVAKLGLPPVHERPNREVYSHAALCLLAVTSGLTPMDFK